MSELTLPGALNLFTLTAVLLIAVALLLWFLRKKSNRHPMDTPRGKAIEEKRREEAKERRADEDQPIVPNDKD